MEWPTRNGISLPTAEVGLPDSGLDLTKPESFNNHHYEWTARKMGQFLITQTLRDLEGLQEDIPRDSHLWLHQNYEPPKFPTIKQALARVVMGYQTGEMLKIYDKDQKKYIFNPITEIHMKQINLEYWRLK